MFKPQETIAIQTETSQWETEFIENAANADMLERDAEYVRSRVQDGYEPAEAINELWFRGREIQERGDIDGGAAMIDRYFDIQTAYEEGALMFRTETVTDRKRQARRIGASVLAGLTIWGVVEFGPKVIENDNTHFIEQHGPTTEQQSFLNNE